MRKLIYLLLLAVISTAFSFAEDSIPDILLKQTLTFAQKDTSELKMDIYRLKGTTHEKQPVMIFMFGGGFKGGKRNDPYYTNYFITLASQGITTISIDYRLGLVDQKITLFNTKAADYAINMAVEDLFQQPAMLLTMQKN
ncbi:MAG: carboxylesterase family protein [Tannerellaceae bacterium]|nr:carboxylesterase family protein [Tannerellaceae bacterium]